MRKQNACCYYSIHQTKRRYIPLLPKTENSKHREITNDTSPALLFLSLSLSLPFTQRIIGNDFLPDRSLSCSEERMGIVTHGDCRPDEIRGGNKRKKRQVFLLGTAHRNARQYRTGEEGQYVCEVERHILLNVSKVESTTKRGFVITQSRNTCYA